MDKIKLFGCRQHNLKNLTFSIPKGAVTVITGISGSGKSSLAFDTLFAEGQRRYLEYLSPQTRSLIKQLPRPDVDLIEGLSPTLAISQGFRQLYPRGIVATYTDIYDFLTILYVNVGEQHSPATGKRLHRHTRQEIIELILKDYPSGTRIQLLAPVKLSREEPGEAIGRLQRMGFIRLRINGIDWISEDPLPPLDEKTQIDVIVDRLEMKEGVRERLALSLETALDLSLGILKVQEGKEGNIRLFTTVYVCPETGISFVPLEKADFNFNSPRGACQACHGLGCEVCHSGRLKPESLACLIRGKGIHQLCAMTVSDLIQEIGKWTFVGKQEVITKEIIPQILTRLNFLIQVGLGYLELSRQGNTLSDGEAQRILLASQIGAKLSGIIYILDEPSLGLHRQDIQHLHQVIRGLNDLGNTVILVEHESSLIKQADYLIELGPGAGIHGGNIIFQGDVKALLSDANSITGQWISGKKQLPPPPIRKGKKEQLEVKKASLHNIKNLSMKIPLESFVAFCGVSGSGKSTLAIDIIGEEIHQYLADGKQCSYLTNYEGIRRLVISQKQADRYSSRSIPATYVNIMKPLRELFAETRLAKARGYTPSRFSLNKRGGRCDTCEGLGYTKVALLSDLMIPCEVCQGQRYNYETLQVTWENLSIAQMLNLTVAEAAKLFRYNPYIAHPLELMQELGLEYLTLGQPFNTLSGGEVQRLRLVADLATKSLEPTLYILDEPSTGLHLQDIEKLIQIFHRLVENGHSLFVIEHHLEILRQADTLIELGPGGGPHGGELLFQGSPAKLSGKDTPTGKLL